MREAISEHQQQSEIVIGWVQMAAAATFAVLYGIVPATFPEDAAFEPVPWALASYALFTCVRLFLAYRHALPNWFLALSVFVDIALLMVTIWSFHIQYEQPPAFYLKAPTLLYIFIMIALRALRFEARYVLLAGGASVAGWLVLVWYAVAQSMTVGYPITRDYIEYMTNFKVLLGAEFDKVISIAMVTLVLATALIRARRTLVRAVAEQAAAAELSRFFDAEVADRIKSADDAILPGRGEVRDAAIMFLDLRGFTPLSRELSPDALMALLGEYQGLLVPLIHANNGNIDKFLGDGIMASFGAAVPSTTYAADALRAADAVMLAATDWAAGYVAAGKPGPRVGCGIATGPVIFGAIGDATRLEYTVIGDAVNLAAKLEKHTKAEACAALTTHETYKLALAQGYRPPEDKEIRRACDVGGVPDPTDLCVIRA